MGLLFRAAVFITVRTKITEYYKTNADPLGGSQGGFQGILLESRNAAFAKQLSIMVGVLGLHIVLPSYRSLILLPPTLDRELIAHRLQASLKAEVLVCFAVDNPDKALEMIQSYW
ncbi:hypothetical protein AGMMS4952_19720 [Spirochaetia bacterium]|nr:hypothetical protein AGMMS4952_19720 [Spirochaetia bacterium]